MQILAIFNQNHQNQISLLVSEKIMWSQLLKESQKTYSIQKTKKTDHNLIKSWNFTSISDLSIFNAIHRETGVKLMFLSKLLMLYQFITRAKYYARVRMFSSKPIKQLMRKLSLKVWALFVEVSTKTDANF